MLGVLLERRAGSPGSKGRGGRETESLILKSGTVESKDSRSTHAVLCVNM